MTTPSSHHRSKHQTALVLALILLGTLLPILGYYAFFQGLPATPAAEAAQQIITHQGTLICLEPLTTYRETFPTNTVYLSYNDLLKTTTCANLPPELSSPTPKYLLCSGGIKSAQAVRHLQALGLTNLSYIPGGAPEWLALPQFSSFSRPSPAHEQFLAVGTFFGVKFIYTLLSAILILLLWNHPQSDLRALFWAMVAFFIGEAFCFISVIFFNESWFLLENLHAAGMTITFAFTFYALLETLDHRLIHYSSSAPCAFAALCKGCIKHQPTPCGLRRLFFIFIPLVALLACIPLSSGFRDFAYNTFILGHQHTYRHPIMHQIYELRVLPIFSLILLALSLVTMFLRPTYPIRTPKIFFSAALGVLAFSYFRLLLAAAFIENQAWFAAWEEITELMFIAGLGLILLVFHRTLLPNLFSTHPQESL